MSLFPNLDQQIPPAPGQEFLKVYGAPINIVAALFLLSAIFKHVLKDLSMM